MESRRGKASLSVTCGIHTSAPIAEQWLLLLLGGELVAGIFGEKKGPVGLATILLGWCEGTFQFTCCCTKIRNWVVGVDVG